MDLSILFLGTEGLANFVYISPFGLLALFLFSIAANATIILPISVELVVIPVAGFSPDLGFVLVVGIVAGIGAAIGEMSGYIFGMLGVKTLQRMSEKKVEKVFEIGETLANKGIPIIFFGALTPFPFDLIGISAGIIKYDPKKFFIGALLGKVARYLLIAVAAFFGLPWLMSLLGT